MTASMIMIMLAHMIVLMSVLMFVIMDVTVIMAVTMAVSVQRTAPVGMPGSRIRLAVGTRVFTEHERLDRHRYGQ